MAWTKESVVASSGSAEAETATAGTEDTSVASSGAAEAEAATAGAREAPTMDTVLRLNHGDVRPYRDSYLFVWSKTMRLAQKHGNGMKWRLGEEVCDWVEEATRSTSGNEETVTAGIWQEEAVTAGSWQEEPVEP